MLFEPGPGFYNDKRHLNKNIPKWRFPLDNQRNIVKTSDTPGPGAYNVESDIIYRTKLKKSIGIRF